jgi:hypothetical protein
MRIRILLTTVLMLLPSLVLAQPEGLRQPERPGQPDRFYRPRPGPRLIPVVRMYCDELDDHLYVTDRREVEAREREGYHTESATYSVAAEEQPGLVPLYRFFNPNTGGHMLSTNPRLEGLRREGVIGYVAPQKTPGMVALYGFISPDRDRQFYTLDPRGEAAPDNGFQATGVVGYVYPLREGR